jgi:hypothetical protein
VIVEKEIIVTTDCNAKNFIALPTAVTDPHEMIYGTTKTLTVSKKLENDL